MRAMSSKAASAAADSFSTSSPKVTISKSVFIAGRRLIRDWVGGNIIMRGQTMKPVLETNFHFILRFCHLKFRSMNLLLADLKRDFMNTFVSGIIVAILSFIPFLADA